MKIGFQFGLVIANVIFFFLDVKDIKTFILIFKFKSSSLRKASFRHFSLKRKF